MSLSGFCGQQTCSWCTYIHLGKDTYTQNNTLKYLCKKTNKKNTSQTKSVAIHDSVPLMGRIYSVRLEEQK